MKKLSKYFYGNRLKKGSIMSILTLIVLGILIVSNFVIGKANLNKDLTKNKLFSLSDQSYKILGNLKQDITIYGFYESGKENYTVKTILDQYKAKSKHIKVEYKDPSKYPQLVQKYSSENSKIAAGSLVIENGSKFKVVDEQSFVNYDYTNSSAQSLSVEQNITSAILYVTSDKSAVVYNLQGHGEPELPVNLAKQLQLENYTISPLNLSLKNSTLKEDSILLVFSPQRDLSEDETKTLKDYLSKGGRAIFLMNLTEKDTPNFQILLKDYGLSLQRAITVEENSQYVSQNPISLLPKQEDHTILQSLNKNNLRVFIPGAQSLNILESKKPSLKVTPLLTTSEDSYGKINLKATTLEKESGDLKGPFNIAAAIEDKASADKDIRIVVVANASFTNPQAISLSGDANLDFFMNSVNWVQDKKDNISVRPKTLDNYTLQISAFNRITFSTFIVIVIPAVVAITGIIVWAKRRKK